MGSRILIHNLGYPRMGALRQLKQAVEAFWRGAESEADVQRTASGLRTRHWLQQKEAGIDLIPSNDFSFYDHVLDTCAMVGAVPERFGPSGQHISLTTYFAMARGQTEPAAHEEAGCNCGHAPAHAMEMTKWFDTNYHYIVPEFRPGQTFALSSTKAVNEFQEAFTLSIKTKPVFVGPLTFLKLGKIHDAPDFDRLELLKSLTPVYIELLRRLARAGAEWVQFDEPILSLDLTQAERVALVRSYNEMTQAVPALKFMVATYFGELRDNRAAFLRLPVQALHVDVTRAADELPLLLEEIPSDKMLSLGLVDGRNIWKNDYAQSLEVIRQATNALGSDRLLLAPSCSLLHVPVSLRFETKLEPQLKSWLAFADEKLVELSELRQTVEGKTSLLHENDAARVSRRTSDLIHSVAIQKRCESVQENDLKRDHPFAERREAQQEHLRLPAFPTTTIGSFPQTTEVRSQRAHFRKGKITRAEYETFLEQETARVIRWQEEIGLDVLVHGEFERTDMVEYFGEQLRGFAFTQNGWVQSYGSRCVKPPVLFGDVSRPEPMTVRWSQFAQEQTNKPMKGMLTGPITILQWSFVRDDQPRSATAKQIALAIRDEVRDLEAAGISVIQVDEPALREGLPLRRADWAPYLRWSVDAFRLATAVAADATQIHTHMCYCEFNDIIAAIADLDADVISIESSRSNMDLLEAFRVFRYPNEVGPGIYDIHSPQIPTTDEMTELLHKAQAVLPGEQLWVNPDCGLKTRGWPEVEQSLRNMVEAARRLRASLRSHETNHAPFVSGKI
jgi:5-methyltetrahydropteroyltriglutamate--homocysteine methyltransferase